MIPPSSLRRVALLWGAALALLSGARAAATDYPMLPDEPVTVEKIATGFSSLEGPVWIDDAQGGHLVFSNQSSPFALWTWREDTGKVKLRDYAKKVNGNAVDGQGRLITCESGNRRVTRTEADGSVTVLVDKFNDQTLNEPNDVIVKSDGTIWFTTPSWTASELSRQYVLRHDPATGATTKVIEGVDKPNGLVFSPDESILYLNDNGGNKVRRYLVNPDGTVTADGILAQGLDKWPDGAEVDAYGNIFTAVHSGAQRGINIRDPQGNLLLRIPLTNEVTNCAWGEADRRTLFITSGDSLYRVRFPDLPPPPDAPQGLRLNWREGSGLVATWTAPAGDLLYSELTARAGDTEETHRRATGSAATLTWVDPAAGAHQFQLHAVGVGGASEATAPVWFDAASDLFRHSQDEGGNLRGGAPFGQIFCESYPWVYHFTHGWWYTVSSVPGSLWVYDAHPALGWLWTNAAAFPALYRAEPAGWLGYVAGTAPEPRWFWNYTAGDWELVE